MTKAAVQGSTVTFGPTLVKVKVNNDAGCQDFSVDLTLPVDWTPDTTGLDTVCAYTGSGVAWDCAWTSSATSSVSNTLTRAGLTHFSQWAAGRNTGPCNVTAAPAVSISIPYTPWVYLTWPPTVYGPYEVWTAQNAPYFNIGGKQCSSPSPYACKQEYNLSYGSSDLGNPASNPSYQVRAVNNCGQLSAPSNRVGGFTFSLVKGN